MRTILQRVADGSLAPEEALAALSELGETSVFVTEPPIRRVELIGRFDNIEVVGEEGRGQVVAEVGDWAWRREGDTLIIEGDPFEQDLAAFRGRDSSVAAFKAEKPGTCVVRLRIRPGVRVGGTFISQRLIGRKLGAGMSGPFATRYGHVTRD